MENQSPLPSLAGLLPDSLDQYSWHEDAMEDDEALSAQDGAGAFPNNLHRVDGDTSQDAAPGSGGSTASTTSTFSLPPAQCRAIAMEEDDVQVLAHKFQKVAIRRDVYKSCSEDLRDTVKKLEAAFKKQDDINKKQDQINKQQATQNAKLFEQNITKLFEDTDKLRLEVATLRRTRPGSGPSA